MQCNSTNYFLSFKNAVRVLNDILRLAILFGYPRPASLRTEPRTASFTKSRTEPIRDSQTYEPSRTANRSFLKITNRTAVRFDSVRLAQLYSTSNSATDDSKDLWIQISNDKHYFIRTE